MNSLVIVAAAVSLLANIATPEHFVRVSHFSVNSIFYLRKYCFLYCNFTSFSTFFCLHNDWKSLSWVTKFAVGWCSFGELIYYTKLAI